MSKLYSRLAMLSRATITLLRVSPRVISASSLLQECHIHRYVAPTLSVMKDRKRRMPAVPQPRNGYAEWNIDAEIYAFSQRLKEDFDLDLLKQAFTHRSYVNQQQIEQRAVGIETPSMNIKDNKELIEEGEAFMSDYIKGYLLAALPKFPEEGIISIRDYLMQTSVLSEVSLHLGTKDIILSDAHTPGEVCLAQTLNAIVGALIQSSGVEKAAHFVRDFVITKLSGMDVNDLWNVEDPLKLLEELLSKMNKTPEFRLIGHLGKNTIISCCRVGIYIDKEMFCYGYGENIAIAKEMATREALKVFYGSQENMPPLDFKIPGIPNDCSEKIKSAVSS